MSSPARYRALDLFCGAGGAAMGLHRAGFDVTGIDNRPQPRYPFRFIQGDALNPPVRLADFDLVWASPPCQAHSMFSRNTKTAHRHVNRIPETRDLLANHPCTVIENVPGAPLRTDLVLCGSMFGLRVRRHRWFELSGFAAMAPSCRHDYLAVYVVGNGTPQWYRRKHGRNAGKDEWEAAMGIDWMTKAGIAQAIPPAYSEWIGTYAMMALNASGTRETMDKVQGK